MAHRSFSLNKISAGQRNSTYNSSWHSDMAFGISNANGWYIKILFVQHFVIYKNAGVPRGVRARVLDLIGHLLGFHRMWFIKRCSVCTPHFSFIICNCHLEYVQHVHVNKKSIQFLKSNRGRPDEQASYAVCVRGRRPEQSSTRSRKNKWLQAHSALEFVRIIRAPVYPSVAFVRLNSFRLFPPSRCALM